MSKSINLYNQLANCKLFNKSINFDLNRIKLALKKLDNPERKLKNVINVIGSDGKYSFLSSLKFFIEANGQKSSAYISPSIKDIKERFWMGESFLSHKKIEDSIKIIKKLKVKLTVFEVLTIIYIINAAKMNNDYNLVEAGALFAKDSTNVFKFPKSQVIVNINKQHLNFLKKKTLNEVIYQKVAFLSQFTNIYVGKQKLRVFQKIKSTLKKNKSKIDYSKSWKLVKIKNSYFYKDSNSLIRLNTKYIHSKGLLENLCLAVKVALDLGIKKKIIIKTIPKIKFEARIQYLKRGKLFRNLEINEKILIDGCHSETSAANLASYLKTLKVPIFGIWSMTKNKDPNKFIHQFKGVFKKLYTVPINNESASLSNKLLHQVAKRNKFKTELSNSFIDAIKKISSKEKKIICIFGSLYLCGKVLNKN